MRVLALAGLLSLAAAPDPPSGFVEVPQGRLWYQEAGRGPALVLIHDGLLPSESWDAQMEPLARHFRVVRYDRRFHGRSTSETRDYQPEADLLALLDGLGIDRATLLGCSAGGGLALDFALAHPSRVEALVLAGPVVSGFGYSQHFVERGLRNRLPLILRDDKDGVVAAWAVDRYITDERNASARARVAELLVRYPFSAGGGQVGGRPPARPALPNLAELKVPTLLITGESDIPDVHAHIGAIAAGIPGAERQVVPRAGHLVHLEQPEEFNRRVLDFLAPASHVAELLAGLQGEPELAGFSEGMGAPLGFAEKGTEGRGEVRVIDLRYFSPRGGRVPAYLVLPRPGPPGPAVLFLHHGQGDRGTLLDEAVELAGRGFTSLSISAPDKRPDDPQPEGPPYDPAFDRNEIEQTVLDLRRGLQVLAARAEVDPGRIGYVGYSLGATMGARLLGLEPRIRASVQIAGFPALTLALDREQRRAGTGFRTYLDAEQRRAYVKQLAPYDGVRFLARRRETPLLLQFARGDEFVSSLDAAIFAAAAPSATTSWYDGGHFSLGAGAAREERRVFLERALAPR